MQGAYAMLSSVACSGLQIVFILSHKRYDFRKKFIELIMCFDFLYNCF